MPLRRIEFFAVAAGFILLWAILLVSLARPADLRALNRAAEPRPDFSLLAFSDADYRARWTGWFTDKLVLAGPAREIDRIIEQRLFSDTADSRVIDGLDGWLYLNRDHGDVSLLPSGDGAREAAAIDGVVSALEALGARGVTARFALAPHKPGVYPQYLPPASRERVEAERTHRKRLLSQLDGPAGARMIDVFDAMAAKAGAAGLYLKTDTHWSAHGAAVMAEALVDSLAPGLWETAVVAEAGRARFMPDLVRLQGGEAREDRPVLDVTRPGVQVERAPRPGEGAWIERSRASGPDGALLGELVVIGDSYANELIPLLAPFFEAVRFVHVQRLETPEARDALAGADLVFIQIVERHMLTPPPDGLAGLGARIEAALEDGGS
ncbi:MAG: alginate O-acetyltransferase AlgX-related protein [Oceanicaulis sp.]